MSLFDQMAADLAALSADGADLAVQGTLQAAQTGGPTGTVWVVFGDNTDALQIAAAGMTENRAAPVTFRRSEVLAILGRGLIDGDRLVIASGADAGTWIVSTAVGDDGGGIVAAMRLDRQHSVRRVQG